jgi:hypothetical protein
VGNLHAERQRNDVTFAARLCCAACAAQPAADRLAKDDQNRFVEPSGSRDAVLGMARFGATPVPQ